MPRASVSDLNNREPPPELPPEPSRHITAAPRTPYGVDETCLNLITTSVRRWLGGAGGGGAIRAPSRTYTPPPPSATPTGFAFLVWPTPETRHEFAPPHGRDEPTPAAKIIVDPEQELEAVPDRDPLLMTLGVER